MSSHYYVRIGVLGQVGRFRPVDGCVYRRGARAVCRTARGLEVGEVLGRCEEADESDLLPQADGELLRAVTPSDDLLIARLEKNRTAAYEACVARLQALAIDATLIDVEHLFDGASLYFYFLGDLSPAVAEVTAELAEVYDARAQFRQFAETVAAGCGPDCGTDKAGGCGDSCGSCAVAAACGTKK